ncbi:MAG: ECF transporter S component [Lachnospiraceae bacterium]|nr:ECF transporter S component [Lachnospiraceae bacterium]
MKTSKTIKIIIGIVLAGLGLAAIIFTRSAGIKEEASTLEQVLFALSLILFLIGLIVVGSAFMKPARPTDIRMLSLAAMLAALCYIGFAFFKIDIPIPGTAEKTAFHLGNVFCVLAALLIGGLWGGMAGAVGMTIGDFLTGYVTSAPKTFLLKLGIGLITGFVAYKLLKLDHETDKKKILWKTVVSTSAGMLFNVVADPLVGYLYKRFLYGLQQDLAKALAKISAVTTLVNAVIAVIAATIFYLALRPAIRRLLNTQ